mgnify:CR=1 FL=1
MNFEIRIGLRSVHSVFRAYLSIKKEERREAHSGGYSKSLNLFVEQRKIVIGIRTDNEELGGTTRDAPILKAIGKARKIGVSKHFLKREGQASRRLLTRKWPKLPLQKLMGGAFSFSPKGGSGIMSAAPLV